MKKYFTLIKELRQLSTLLWQRVKSETKNIKSHIIYSEAPVMIKSFFQAIEAAFRAVTYLLILIIGLIVAALGTYIVLFTAFRTGQFLWELLFKEAWL